MDPLHLDVVLKFLLQALIKYVRKMDFRISGRVISPCSIPELTMVLVHSAVQR